jgi:hypothetical protein
VNEVKEVQNYDLIVDSLSRNSIVEEILKKYVGVFELTTE